MTASRWQPVEATDGHRWQVLQVQPPAPRSSLLWLPALGVAARHYEPFAHALAASGVAVTVHEWRGIGTSSVRASRLCDWGYMELLTRDLPATHAAMDPPRDGRIIGGHSLGGQLACCLRALDASVADRLWLVATGSPWFRAFPSPARWGLPFAYRLLPRLADVCGALPGRRIGFGGRESRGVLKDWSRTALTGRYSARGVGDLQRALQAVNVEADTVLLANDWLAPATSLDALLRCMSLRAVRMTTLDAAALGAWPDHFAWMKAPAAVARALIGGPSAPGRRVTPTRVVADDARA